MSCDALSLVPVPDEEQLRRYYNQIYMVPAEVYANGTRRSAPPVLRRLADLVPAKGKLLEVGCSYGAFLDAARRDGWEPFGIEIDSAAAIYAREKLGIETLCGTLEASVPKLKPPYDTIVAFHVIEHVLDPIRFLQACRSLLRKNGVLMLKTPNAASWIARNTGAYWQWMCPPAHIHLFSPRTLGVALSSCDFQVERVWSQRGDAHNNGLELVCAIGRKRAALRLGAVAETRERKSWSGQWQVNLVKTASDILYYPLGLVVDPLLARYGAQPELVAIARA